MEVIQGLEKFQEDSRDLVLALGSFDGMHLGHQKVIKRAVYRARKIKGKSMVVTFHPHPRQTINPGNHLSLLTTGEQKLQLIDCLEIDLCLIINFDKKFSQMPPREFVAKILHQHLQVKEIFVGSDYLFGREKIGDLDFLIKMGREYGFQANKVKALQRKGEAISSTRIRQLIKEGKLGQARELLGRPYSILGKVKKGDKKANLTGYPTANLGPGKEILLPEGAYAAWMCLDKKAYVGVVGIVERNKKKIVEAHLFNFHGNLYGSKMEVFFWKRIRGKKHFSNKEEARKQIAEDKEATQKILKGFPLQNLNPVLE